MAVFNLIEMHDNDDDVDDFIVGDADADADTDADADADADTYADGGDLGDFIILTNNKITVSSNWFAGFKN